MFFLVSLCIIMLFVSCDKEQSKLVGKWYEYKMGEESSQLTFNSGGSYLWTYNHQMYSYFGRAGSGDWNYDSRSNTVVLMNTDGAEWIYYVHTLTDKHLVLVAYDGDATYSFSR